MIFTVNTNLTESVFFLKFGSSTGTSFTMTINDQQYLVTARHMFPGLVDASPVNIEIFHENVWKQIDGELWLHTNFEIDICAIKIPAAIATKHEFKTDPPLIFGQDLFMLGFPYGYYNIFKTNNPNYPFPFVKKGGFSAAHYYGDGRNIIFLDGHNNKGFSGGPVCYTNNNTKETFIVSVISAYITQEGLINTPFGDWKYSENSGIVITYSIKHFLEIVDAHTGV